MPNLPAFNARSLTFIQLSIVTLSPEEINQIKRKIVLGGRSAVAAAATLGACSIDACVSAASELSNSLNPQAKALAEMTSFFQRASKKALQTGDTETRDQIAGMAYTGSQIIQINTNQPSSSATPTDLSNQISNPNLSAPAASAASVNLALKDPKLAEKTLIAQINDNDPAKVSRAAEVINVTHAAYSEKTQLTFSTTVYDRAEKGDLEEKLQAELKALGGKTKSYHASLGKYKENQASRLAKMYELLIPLQKENDRRDCFLHILREDGAHNHSFGSPFLSKIETKLRESDPAQIEEMIKLLGLEGSTSPAIQAMVKRVRGSLFQAINA